MRVLSVPNERVYGRDATPIRAGIDWRKIEEKETLDEVGADAVHVKEIETDEPQGTWIELTKLRKSWTPAERSRVIREVNTFRPPDVLINVPRSVHEHPLLFSTPLVRDVVRDGDPGFDLRLTGDFDVGEQYWDTLTQAAEWILEISADHEKNLVRYLITPTTSNRKPNGDIEQHRFRWRLKSDESVPSLQARILVRVGSEGVKKEHRPWLVESAGIKVYMEGFRVLPYGAPGDDWLEIDFDYSRRQRSLRFLEEAAIDLSSLEENEDPDLALVALRNQSFFGAVFLTREGTRGLEMLVNREGFIPNADFLALQRIVRTGIDLMTRVRAFEGQRKRIDRRLQRREKVVAEEAISSGKRLRIKDEAENAVQTATELAKTARSAAAAGNTEKAQRLVAEAAQQVHRASTLTSELVTDRAIMQILAGVGLQMAAFVHEINGLLGMASAVEKAVERIRGRVQLDRESAREFAKLSQSVTDLRHAVERQASYLTDITSPDARRRRSRQKLSERFDASTRLVTGTAADRNIAIRNDIPEDLRSPPMFPAELMVIYSNLLTNAVKACKRDGRIRASGRQTSSGNTVLRIENTGIRVDLRDADKWFLPFKSTTVQSDPILGQGMGMGLPIVRNILDEYGATIRFVEPSEAYSTAVEVRFSQ
jgi:signal transduction histidine kinase